MECLNHSRTFNKHKQVVYWIHLIMQLQSIWHSQLWQRWTSWIQSYGLTQLLKIALTLLVYLIIMVRLLLIQCLMQCQLKIHQDKSSSIQLVQSVKLNSLLSPTHLLVSSKVLTTVLLDFQMFIADHQWIWELLSNSWEIMFTLVMLLLHTALMAKVKTGIHLRWMLQHMLGQLKLLLVKKSIGNSVGLLITSNSLV